MSHFAIVRVALLLERSGRTKVLCLRPFHALPSELRKGREENVGKVDNRRVFLFEAVSRVRSRNDLFISFWSTPS